jgi:TrmH family RNA methyltransferase
LPHFYSISSPANPLIKDVRRAILRGSLTESGLCAAESFHLLDEALRSNRPVDIVLAAESARHAIERQFADTALDIALVPDQLFSTLSTTETSQGLIALVKPPEWTINQLFTDSSLIVVLDAIQDPGNAGAIVRAAEAFAASGVMFLKGSVSPFNPKTLRASAGSLFRVPYVAALEPAIARAAVEQNRLRVYAGMPHDGRGDRPRLERPCALVIGNEGRGVSEEFRASAEPVSIPTAGVESLNASIAAAILLYEAYRHEPL